jgi:arginine/lysine/ornithine decarboxylase
VGSSYPLVLPLFLIYKKSEYNHSYSNFFYENLSLAEVKEYNFLGNIIDNKGRLKRSAQELSKKGLKTFFSWLLP